jgi:pilus assembly protein CpaB
MKRKRWLMMGATALLLAAAVTFGFNRMMGLSAARHATVPVVVAAADLAVGARIDATSVRLAAMPAGNLPLGVFHNIADVVGRGVLVPMTENETVLSSKIAGEHAGAGLPAVIPDGMRAVSVKVNDVISVAGFVMSGTHVDVLLTGNPTKDSDPGKIMTTTVLENVQVLAAGTKLEPDSKGQAQNVPVITLQVSPEDAQKLTLASTQGKIQLALRNPLDVQKMKPDTVLNAELYRFTKPVPVAVKRAAGRAQAKPAPVVAAVYVVEVIRGDKKDVAKF